MAGKFNTHSELIKKTRFSYLKDFALNKIKKYPQHEDKIHRFYRYSVHDVLGWGKVPDEAVRDCILRIDRLVDAGNSGLVREGGAEYVFLCNIGKVLEEA